MKCWHCKEEFKDEDRDITWSIDGVPFHEECKGEWDTMVQDVDDYDYDFYVETHKGKYYEG